MVKQRGKKKESGTELNTEPLSNITLTMSPIDTMIRRIVLVMNIISSLFAIILYVGGCDCMPLVPVRPAVANLLCKLILDIVRTNSHQNPHEYH